MTTIDDRYTRMFASSAKAYEKAVGYFPSGITHQNRYAMPFPVYFNRAMAGVKFDLDGNEIIDYVMTGTWRRSSWSPPAPTTGASRSSARRSCPNCGR